MANLLTLRNQDLFAEILLTVLCCAAPWAYGSVDALPQYLIYGGLFAVVILRTISDWRSKEHSLGSGPIYWALLALVAIALVQAVPLNEKTIEAISPRTLEMRKMLVPDPTVTVRGDTLPAVAAPASTISIDSNETWRGLVRLLAVFLLFDCASRSRVSFSTYELFAKVVVMNSAMITLFAFVQALSWNGKIFWVRDALSPLNNWHAGGPFFNHNHLAAALNVGLGLSLGLLFKALEDKNNQSEQTMNRFLLVYSTGLIAVGVITSQSRGGVLAMIIAFLIILGMLRIRPSRVLPVLAMIFLFAVVFLTSIGSWASFQRLGSISESLASGMNGRVEVWQSALRTWKNAPILGSGFGTYGEATAPYYSPTEVGFHNHFTAHGESEYVEMLVEAGSVGLVLLLIAVFDLFRKAFRTLRQAPREAQTLLLGGLFGLTTLTTQSMADFPLHVAGVTVPAFVLASKLYRMKFVAKGEQPQGAARMMGRLMVTLKNLALIAAAGFLLYYQAAEVKIESKLERAGVALPGSRWVSIKIPLYPKIMLEEMKVALTDSLKIRPNWTEGYALLGQVELGLYRYAAADALGIQVVEYKLKDMPAFDPFDPRNAVESSEEDVDPNMDPNDPSTQGDPLAPSKDGKSRSDEAKSVTSDEKSKAVAGQKGTATAPVTPAVGDPTAPDDLANGLDALESDGPAAAEAQALPIWLHKVVSDLRKLKSNKLDTLLDEEPVKQFLIPATRNFLQARRCCPWLALPHLQLGMLDYLLTGKDTGLEYTKRGIALSANHSEIYLVAAQVAVNLGDNELAKEYWARYLRKNPLEWDVVANSARDVLNADQMMEVAKAGGTNAVFHIGEMIYEGPLQFVTRLRFMETALAMLPTDKTLAVLATNKGLNDKTLKNKDDEQKTAEERLFLEGRILGELAQYDNARELMRKALTAQPMNANWRLEYINMLMSWNCYDEAYKLALVGMSYHPKDWRFKQIAKICLEYVSEAERGGES